MKRILSAAFAAALFFCSAPVSATGQPEQMPEHKMAAPTETVELRTDRFRSEDTLLTTGNYDSSVFFAGESVTDETTVNGINFSLGNKLKMSGEYEYGFQAGINVVLDGSFEKDVFALGDKVELSGEFGRDVYVAASKVEIKSDIQGSVFIFANEVLIDGATIGGDATISTAVLKFANGARIEKHLSYSASATLEGDIMSASSNTFNDTVKVNAAQAYYVSIVASLVLAITTIVVFGFLCKKFFVSLERKTEEYSVGTFSVDTLIGLAASIIVPIISVLLMMTIAGLPAGYIIFNVFVILLYLASLVSAVVFGQRLLKIKNHILAGSAAIIIYTALGLIPYVGSIISVIFCMNGFGVITRMFLSKPVVETESFSATIEDDKPSKKSKKNKND